MICLRGSGGRQGSSDFTAQHYTPVSPPPAEAEPTSEPKADNINPLTLADALNTEIITKEELLARAKDVVDYLLHTGQIRVVHAIEVKVNNLLGESETYRMDTSDSFVRTLKKLIGRLKGVDADALMLYPDACPGSALATARTSFDSPTDVKELSDGALLRHDDTVIFIIDSGSWLMWSWCDCRQAVGTNSGFEVRRRTASSCVVHHLPEHVYSEWNPTFLFVDPTISMKKEKKDKNSQTHVISMRCVLYDGLVPHVEPKLCVGLAPRFVDNHMGIIERRLCQDWLPKGWHINLWDISQFGGTIPNNKIITLKYDRDQQKLHIWVNTHWLKTIENVAHHEEEEDPLSWVILGLDGAQCEMRLVRPPHDLQPPGLVVVTVTDLRGLSSAFELKADPSMSTVGVLKERLSERFGYDSDALMLYDTDYSESVESVESVESDVLVAAGCGLLTNESVLYHGCALRVVVDTSEWLFYRWTVVYQGDDNEVAVEKRRISFNNGVYSAAVVEPSMAPKEGENTIHTLAVIFHRLPPPVIEHNDGLPPARRTKALIGLQGKTNIRRFCGKCFDLFANEGDVAYDGQTITLEYDIAQTALNVWVGTRHVATTSNVCLPSPVHWFIRNNGGSHFSLQIVSPPVGREPQGNSRSVTHLVSCGSLCGLE